MTVGFRFTSGGGTDGPVVLLMRYARVRHKLNDVVVVSAIIDSERDYLLLGFPLRHSQAAPGHHASFNVDGLILPNDGMT